MPKAKAKQQFKHDHAVQYGLKVTARHVGTGRVSSVTCRFCIVFGREDNVGAKRKRTTNAKYFTTFRADGYKRHLEGQHQEKWAQYQQLSTSEEKEAFFSDVATPYANTLAAHGCSTRPLEFNINGPIVDVIIGELLFHPDDVEGVTRQRALSLFSKLESADSANGDLAERDIYRVVVKNAKRFNLLVKFVGCGASFRLASRLMECTRAESGIAHFGGCSDVVASNYTRIVCAVALQYLSEILSDTWAFSLALDSSTHQGLSYLDVRVRVCFRRGLHNFHLLAIPLFERHTGENMYNVLERFLEALLGDSWRHACIGVSSDGARSMTGRVNGLVTRIERTCVGGLVRVWCGLHKLDLVMQRVYKPALDDEFYFQLTALIGHLRRQQNLVAEMRSTCPKVTDTRWISMSSSTRWLVSNRVRVQQHLDNKRPACTPTPMWWTFLHFISAFAEEARAVFVSLQGLTTLASKQRQRLSGLIDTYCRMSGMQGPLDAQQIADIDEPAESSGRYVLTHARARSAMDGLGMYIIETLDAMPAEDVSKIVAAVARMLVDAAAGIDDILGDGRDNEAVSDEVPPVMPFELAKVDTRSFVKLLQTQRPRLLRKFSEQEIEDMSSEFVQFKRAAREEPVLAEALKDSEQQFNKSISRNDFAAGWGVVDNRFPTLQNFCGGLASVFPNTATVESDFSIIGWEKDDTRMDLTDFSLEGILHCKQFAQIRSVFSAQ